MFCRSRVGTVRRSGVVILVFLVASWRRRTSPTRGNSSKLITKLKEGRKERTKSFIWLLLNDLWDIMRGVLSIPMNGWYISWPLLYQLWSTSWNDLWDIMRGVLSIPMTGWYISWPLLYQLWSTSWNVKC